VNGKRVNGLEVYSSESIKRVMIYWLGCWRVAHLDDLKLYISGKGNGPGYWKSETPAINLLETKWGNFNLKDHDPPKKPPSPPPIVQAPPMPPAPLPIPPWMKPGQPSPPSTLVPFTPT
jgi:hypothetical protein